MRPLSILHLLSNRWWTGTAEPVLALTQGLLERRQRVSLGVPAGSQVEDLARKAGIPLLKGLAVSIGVSVVAVVAGGAFGILLYTGRTS